MQYDLNKGIAYPKELEDPEQVNKRRKAMGMESLEEYLEMVTRSHREMNRKKI